MPASKHRLHSAPSIAVLTCDRPGAFYLGDTIRQIDSEGGAPLDRRLYVDGSEGFAKRLEEWLYDNRRIGWSVIRLGEKLGSSEAMRRLLRMETVHGTDLLFFEDDLELCKNTVHRMVHQSVPSDTWLISFFDAKEVTDGAPIGIHRRPPNGHDRLGFRCSQALKFKAAAIRILAEADWNVYDIHRMKMGSDHLIGEILASHPTTSRIGIHIPSLVQHVGRHSACFKGMDLTDPLRTTQHYPGREFDALTLPDMA